MGKKQSLGLELDKWDSGFFKQRIARLILRDKAKVSLGELKDVLGRAKKKRVRFLVARFNTPSPKYARLLRSVGFKKVDESVSLSFDTTTKLKLPSSSKSIRFYKLADLKAISRIAQDAFRLSYFYRCGFARKEVIDHYHALWAENLCKDPDCCVFVAQQAKEVCGSLELKLDKQTGSAKIVLIAVDRCFQGRGFGRSLIDACIRYAMQNGIRCINVRTQRKNLSALLLYEKAGFKISGYDATFCKTMR